MMFDHVLIICSAVFILLWIFWFVERDRIHQWRQKAHNRIRDDSKYSVLWAILLGFLLVTQLIGFAFVVLWILLSMVLALWVFVYILWWAIKTFVFMLVLMVLLFVVGMGFVVFDYKETEK